MPIAKATIDAVKALPVSSVIEAEGVRLKKIGREFLVKCPFHKDTNPSMTINDDKGICFCFVCKGGNDAIAFIQQKFGLNFSEAIERIAEKHNIQFQLDNINPEQLRQQRAKRKNQISHLEQNQEQYRNNLKDPKASRIRDILVSRGVTPETAREFGIGFCVDGFFASRITIPIHNHKGELVGFSARATLPDQTPKYKNSSTSELFDKSELVFNEYKALSAIREADSIVFVEGQFDVISMYQSGIRNVVAIQGTATPSNAVIQRLAKRSKRFILCYDGDQGGIKAIEQFLKVTGPMACRGELTITIANLPDGMDPDQCINDPNVDLYDIISNAPSWLDWQLDTWLANLDRSDTHYFSKVEAAIRELIQSIQSPALRQYYIDKASKALVSDGKAAVKLATQWTESIPKVQSKRSWTKPSPHQTRANTEKRLLRLYIHAPEMRDYCKPLFAKVQSPAYKWLATRIEDIEKQIDTVTPDHVMAVLLASEPHYLRQLRPVAVPTIKIDKSPGILRHIEDTLCKELTFDHGNTDEDEVPDAHD